MSSCLEANGFLEFENFRNLRIPRWRVEQQQVPNNGEAGVTPAGASRTSMFRPAGPQKEKLRRHEIIY